MKLTEKQVKEISNMAADGCKVTFVAHGADKVKTLWAGLGNRAGLHGYVSVVLSQKWEKSGPSFVKRLRSLEDGVLTVLDFRNITRDRGKWVAFKKITLL